MTMLDPTVVTYLTQLYDKYGPAADADIFAITAARKWLHEQNVSNPTYSSFREALEAWNAWSGQSLTTETWYSTGITDAAGWSDAIPQGWSSATYVPAGVPTGSTYNWTTNTWVASDGTVYTESEDGTWAAGTTTTTEETTTDGTGTTGSEVPPGSTQIDDETWIDPDGNVCVQLEDGTWVNTGPLGAPAGGLDLGSIADQLESGAITPEEALGLLAKAASVVSPSAELESQLGSFKDIFNATIAPFFPGLSFPGQEVLAGTRPFFEAGYNLRGFAPQPEGEFPLTITDFLRQGTPLTGFGAYEALQAATEAFRKYQDVAGGGGPQYLADLVASGMPLEQAQAMALSFGTLFDPYNAGASADLRLSQLLSPFQAQLSPFVAQPLMNTFSYMQDLYNAQRLASGNPTTDFFIDYLLNPGSIWEDFFKGFEPSDLGSFDFLTPSLGF